MGGDIFKKKEEKIYLDIDVRQCVPFIQHETYNDGLLQVLGLLVS